MRVFAACVAFAVCAACGRTDAPAPVAPSATAAPVSVTPARVERVRSSLPAGYELADLPGGAAPVTLWGFGGGWTADPAPCGTLADPAGPGAVHGWAASGPGGIVYAVVAEAGPVAASTDSCGAWTLAAGPTTGVVTLVGAPPVEGAVTTGMATDATTVVEGGIETHTDATTYVAYLSGYVAYVAVVTDPGLPGPSLRPEFASDLLVQTVAAIRG